MYTTCSNVLYLVFIFLFFIEFTAHQGELKYSYNLKMRLYLHMSANNSDKIHLCGAKLRRVIEIKRNTGMSVKHIGQIQ